MFFVLICIITGSLQSVFKKKLNARCGQNDFTVSFLISGFALLYFLIFSEDRSFYAPLLPYCLGFALSYAVATVTCIFALKCGSLAFTELMLKYSVIFPLFYGIIFLNEPLNAFQVVGIALLFSSFFFSCLKSENEKAKFSVKWLIYVVLLFLSNGACGILMRVQQNVFGGKQDASFMIYSLVAVTLSFLIISIVRKEKVRLTLKNGWLFSGLSGISNGVTNYFGLICLLILPGALYYPIVTAGGLALSFIFSVFFYKERFNTFQIVGFILGVLSMIFINIT